MSTQNRREFLKVTGMALAGGFLASCVSQRPFVGMNTETLRIGLIGCGGRGTGAANQALNADDNVILHAMGDIFPDKMDESYGNLQRVHGEKVQVPADRRFLGFDAYQQVIDSGVDVVLLATPPGFRPLHLEYAIESGKHIFCEKPVAVDAPGIRRVKEAARKSKEMGLAVMSGFCWRHDYPKQAFFNRVLDGDVGEIRAIYNTYNTGDLWFHPRQPEWSETEYQLRNWLYYNWLSGDHINEQAVHSLDMMSWAMGDVVPVRAVGTGGRQTRTEERFGHVYDHFAITYEYPNGARGYHFSRQQGNCQNSYMAEVHGTRGIGAADVTRGMHWIDARRRWDYDGEENNMYQTEHDVLFASIRRGSPYNDADRMANSTMLAIMGRMVAYSGEELTWEEALNSNEKLGPDNYNGWNQQLAVNDVAKPGIYTLQ